MTRKTIRLVQQVVVSVILLGQAVLYAQTASPPPVVKLRFSIDLPPKSQQVVFSPVSKLLAVQWQHGPVQIIDTADGKETALIPFVDDSIFGIQWTKDGRCLLIATSKSTAIWDARDGKRLTTPIKVPRTKYFKMFGRLELSPDEKLLLSVTQDEGILSTAFDRDKAIARVWNLETGQLKYEIKIRGRYASAAFSANGKQILATDEEHLPRLYDVETGRLFAKLEPPHRAIFSESNRAEFSPDGRFVIHMHESGIYIWHSSSAAISARIAYDENSTASSMEGFTPDGKMFVTSQQTRSSKFRTSITLRDCETGEVKATFAAEKWDDWPSRLWFGNDGQTLVVTSGYKYKARTWDVRTGSFKATIPLILKYSRIPLDLDPRDHDVLSVHPTQPIISAAGNKFVRLLDADTGELLQTLENNTWPAEWSSDGKTFVTFTEGLRTAQVWEVR
ncbi:MAG TPA: hypothetical protein VFS76_13035 [Pyrinomonadaceae bacterium]|nr:hypothetical protein [Pyrinomonadaceae bacterium]